MTRIPLSVLDLVPVPSGATAQRALANTIDLARACERAGYWRYWIAEHHLNPGVVGANTPVVISLVAGATRAIRVGSGAVQMGHQTPLAVVEQFGLLDAAFPGRIDLGLGRSGARRPPSGDTAARSDAPPPNGGVPLDPGRRTPRGLLIPEPFSFASLLRSPRFRAQAQLLQQRGAEIPDYSEQIADIVALLQGTYRTAEGIEAHASPGEGAGVEVWILGSTAGESARLAGRLGLPFGANYHVAPAAVLEAIAEYRSSFRPSEYLAEPKVLVSADVVVAEDDAAARWLATGYAPWVRSIRTGAGAMPFPTPEEALALTWTDEERELVRDRVETQFVGSPASVVAGLEILVAETGADELLVTTIAHDHGDRVRSYELLAAAWHRTAVTASGASQHT